MQTSWCELTFDLVPLLLELFTFLTHLKNRCSLLSTGVSTGKLKMHCTLMLGGNSFDSSRISLCVMLISSLLNTSVETL